MKKQSLKLYLPLFTISFLLLATNGLVGQVAKSPYSNAGLGESGAGFITNNSMGGLGLANPNPFSINYLNPALLPFNRVTSFSFGIGGESRTALSNGKSQKNFNGNLLYLAFAFPIAKKYTVSLGLTPFTTVNYAYSTIDQVKNSNELVKYGLKGDGGLNAIFFSQGYQITKNIALGLKASYIFGTINTFTTSEIIYSTEYTVEKNESTNHHGLLLKPSIAYKMKLNENYTINFGATYDISSKLYTSQFIGTQRKRSDNGIISADTIYESLKSKIKYPTGLGIGVGFQKTGIWAVGIDFNAQQWSKFKGLKSDSLKDAYSFSLGGELFPSLNSLSFFRRMIFRGGVKYSKTMLYFNQSQLTDISFSLGASVPVRGLSFIDLSFAAGKRGIRSSDPIRESYYKISLGISLNDRSWFIRPKLE